MYNTKKYEDLHFTREFAKFHKIPTALKEIMEDHVLRESVSKSGRSPNGNWTSGNLSLLCKLSLTVRADFKLSTLYIIQSEI